MLNDNLCSDDGMLIDQDKFIEEVRKLSPTVILMTNTHGIAFSDYSIFPCTEAYSAIKQHSVPAVLKQSEIFGIFVDCWNSRLLCISTQDVYTLENCLLQCTVPATEHGTIRMLKEISEAGKIKNNKQTRVMIITGGHGTQKNEEEIVTPVGGISLGLLLPLILVSMMKVKGM